jgi:hypothetical protein
VEDRRDKSWVIILNKVIKGPYSLDELQQKLEKGEVRATDVTCRASKTKESSEWKFVWQALDLQAPGNILTSTASTLAVSHAHAEPAVTKEAKAEDNDKSYLEEVNKLTLFEIVPTKDANIRRPHKPDDEFTEEKKTTQKSSAPRKPWPLVGALMTFGIASFGLYETVTYLLAQKHPNTPPPPPIASAPKPYRAPSSQNASLPARPPVSPQKRDIKAEEEEKPQPSPQEESAEREREKEKENDATPEERELNEEAAQEEKQQSAEQPPQEESEDREQKTVPAKQRPTEPPPEGF